MSDSSLFSWLFYYAITILRLTEEQFWDATVGEIYSLLNVHKIVNNLAEEDVEETIDDIIPAFL